MARRKIIRKQSLSSRLASLPFDLWLSISESIEIFDWDARAVPIALPLGAACNFLLLLCRAYSALNDDSSADEELFSSNTRMESDLFNVPERRPFFTVLFSTLTLSLILLCILNTFYCYNKKRKYTLMGRKITNEPDTPSARKVKYQDTETPPESPLKRILSWNSDSGEDIWQLDIWDPSKFNLYLACSFSPVHVFSIMYAPFSTYLLFLLIVVSVYMFGMTWKFNTMVKDRAILHSEVLGEYGKKIVHPTLYTQRRDVAVGTDGTIDTFSPAPQSKYVTRDVRESKRPSSMGPSSVGSSNSWGSPIRPSASQPPSSLRHRASLNSLKFHPAGYSDKSTTSSTSTGTTTPKTRSRPWQKAPDYNTSPLARK